MIRNVARRRVDLVHSPTPAPAKATGEAAEAILANKRVFCWLLVRNSKLYLIGHREVFDACTALCLSHVPARYVRSWPERKRRGRRKAS